MRRSFVATMVLSGAVASAVAPERPSFAQPAPEAHLAVALGSDMGSTRAPFPSPDARESSGLLTTLSVTARGRLSPALSAQLRLALVLADVYLPAGAARSVTAWGHPEASLIWRVRDGEPALFASLGIAPPVGGDDAALGRRPFDNQALLLASGQRGWRDGELFAPGRLALTPSARAEVDRGRVQAFGELKLPLLLAVRRGDADPRVVGRSVALSAALGAGAAASFGSWFSVGAAAWLAVDLVPAAEIRGETAPRWTLSVVPELRARLGDHLAATLGSTIFLAGALHGLPAIALGLTGSW